MLAVCLYLGTVLSAAPLEPASDVRESRLSAIERVVRESGDAPLRAFAEEHLAPSFRSDLGEGELLGLLREVRARCGNAGGISLRPTEGGALFTFDGPAGLWDLDIGFEEEPPHRIAALDLRPGEEPEGLDPFAWETLASQLDELEAEGLAGAVLAVRGGEVVLSEGYGFADPERGVPNTPDTVFAIGSTPIDFTKAAVLLLRERGELELDDLVSEHLEGVPADKAAMTIEHLMTGRSGLRNFHGIRGVDADLDLSWIDRDEALRRIFAQELLFAPGEGRAHSHSAWGVLAAIVEVVSGKGYGEFLAEHLFRPAGMERTGLYPLAASLPADEVAVGSGRTGIGAPPAPQHWGETSWLVMGSGGMVSTVTDLHRWLEAMRAGKLLSAESQRDYWTGGVLAGGNDRGFLTTYTEGPDDLVIVCSNVHADRDDLASLVADGLAELALSGSAPPYFFGLVADVEPEAVTIRDVVQGSPAAEAGLRAGDRVLRVDGAPAAEAFGDAVDAAARSGATIELAVEREGSERTIAIAPRPREG